MLHSSHGSRSLCSIVCLAYVMLSFISVFEVGSSIADYEDYFRAFQASVQAVGLIAVASGEFRSGFCNVSTEQILQYSFAACLADFAQLNG